VKVVKSSKANTSQKLIQSNRRFSAKAGLRYVNDEDLTIRRLRSNGGFRYVNSKGAPVRDKRLISRVENLAIPPAWEEVRICPASRGHLQAVGKDARGRKQYRYHERWSELRNENKFSRMADFGRALPRIRRAVARDLRQKQLTKNKVLAVVVRLLELSAVRIGNEQYVNANKSYGLTTLRNRHARVNGDMVHLRFRGKVGKEHEMDIRHPTLAKIIRKCQNLPGQKLFEYVDEQGVHAIASDDVNQYLQEMTGEEFTAKDFRTWKATVLAALILAKMMKQDEKPTNKNVKLAVNEVASQLGNTPAICRKCYIHPSILDGYLNRSMSPLQQQSVKGSHLSTKLRVEEVAVLKLLKTKKPTLTVQLKRSLNEVRR
jgi:DNA topoisomerase-1